MSLLWMDGFDHYGALANMLEGVYSAVDSGANQYSLSTTNPRTGTHALRRGTDTAGVCTRSLGAEKSAVGVGFGFYPDQLPSADDTYHLVQFQDDGGDNQISLVLQSDGSIIVKRGDADAVLDSSEVAIESVAATITAAEYCHIEALVRFDDEDGAIELRVNEVTVINAHNIDTLWTTNAGCSTINLPGCTTGVAHGVTADIDDVFCYDDAGTANNDFLGYRWVETLYPKQDTSSAEWSVSGSVTGFGAINDSTPDDDSAYISSTTSPLAISEFELQHLGENVGGIAALQAYTVARKTDSSDGTVRISMVSQSSLVDGTDHALTTSYSYQTDVLERDPDTGAAWTPTRLNAAKLRVRRIA